MPAGPAISPGWRPPCRSKAAAASRARCWVFDDDTVKLRLEDGVEVAVPLVGGIQGQARDDRRTDRRTPARPAGRGPGSLDEESQERNKTWQRLPISRAWRCCRWPTWSPARRASSARKCSRRWSRPSRRPAAPSTGWSTTSAPRSTARRARSSCCATCRSPTRSRTRTRRCRSSRRSAAIPRRRSATS